MFTNDDHRRFFELIKESTIKNKTFETNKDSYWLAGKVVDNKQIEISLKSNPDRDFNEYIGKINQECGLNINILEGNEYKTRGFKLEKRNYNEKWMVSDFKPDINQANENNYKSEDEYISQTLDIDEILKKKFGFKKINEMSEDELGKLNLSYDEEFIYFLSGCDLGNEVYLQNKSRLEEFKAPDIPFKNIRPETILKIYNYFDKTQLNKKTIEEFIKQFDNPKNLFEAYDEMQKENEESLSFTKYTVVNLYFGDPINIGKVFKYIDQLDTENLKKIDDDTRSMVFDFLDKALNNNKQNVDALLDKFLNTENDGGNLLFKFICNRIEHNNGIDKFENYLSKIFEHYKNDQYDFTKKQKVGYLMYYILKDIYNSITDSEQYIKIILDLLKNENEFKMLGPCQDKDRPTDGTKFLTAFLNRFITQYLAAQFVNSLYKQQEDSTVIIGGYRYDLQKIFGVFKQSYDPQQNQHGYDQNDVDVIKNQLEFYTRILNSPVVEVKTKKTILKLAECYLEKLQQSNEEFADSQFQIYLNKYQKGTKPDNRQNLISRRDSELSQSITNLNLQIRTLEVKSNVTSYFKENWTTWLSFLLIVPIFLYNFKWKPQYISEKTNLENMKEVSESEQQALQKVKNFDYVNTDSGKSHKELIDKVQKFINNGNGILRQQNQQQNKIIPNNEEEMDEEIFEDDEEKDRDL